MADKQQRLVAAVVAATRRLYRAGDALKAAEDEAEQARIAQSKAWTALRRYQDDLVAAQMPELESA